MKVYDAVTGRELQSFFAFSRTGLITADPGDAGGVRVGVAAVNAAGVAGMLTSGTGTAAGGVASTSAWSISDGSLFETSRQAQAGRPFDQQFLADVGRDNLAEITLGQVALERSTNLAVRGYAQNELVNEHTAFQIRLRTLLAARGLPEPAPAPQDDASALWLRSLPADRFDRVFTEFIEDAHRRTAQRYELELALGVDGDARGYAADLLPHIRQHRLDAARLRAAFGGS